MKSSFDLPAVFCVEKDSHKDRTYKIVDGTPKTDLHDEDDYEIIPNFED